MPTQPPALEPLDRSHIEGALRDCPRLPSLGSINSVLHELLNAEQCYTAQMSEVIRRDPSMTTRLLRLVNSVYFGLSCPITSIEEAVFYLGVRQIRQLSMVTPIIEDLQRLTSTSLFPWREFWQHCIATAILTREIIGEMQSNVEEIDYVSGLLHDVGKIAMVAAFREHFAAIHRRLKEDSGNLLLWEREILGMDHCELGALYLKMHSLPEIVVDTVRFHHQPENAPRHTRVISAVQIADLTVRHARIGNSGNPLEISNDEWLAAAGWNLLFPENSEEKSLAFANLKRSLERLPSILEGLV